MDDRLESTERARDGRATNGRPFGPLGPTKQISVRVPVVILDQADRIAELRGETRADVVIAALQGWLSE